MFSDPLQSSGPNGPTSTNQRIPDSELAPSGGIMNWWYRIAAPQITSERPTLAERELLRRGRLAATLILVILVIGGIGLPIGAARHDAVSLGIQVIGEVSYLVAWALNRNGYVSAASILMAATLEGILASIILVAPHITAANLFLLPLLVVGQLIAVSLLAPWTVFLVGAVNSAFAVFVLLKGKIEPGLGAAITDSGGVSQVLGPVIAVYVILAVVTFLWVRGAMNALIARDRAEELAQLEHSVAEQRRSLELGMRQIHDTLVRVANGDYNARAPMDRNNVLWQLSASLNNMIARQQKVSDAQYQLQRVASEASRLTEAVRQARMGRPPLWPAETGTPLDPLIRELAGVRAPAMNPGPMPTSGQMGSLGSAPGFSQLSGGADNGTPGFNPVPGPNAIPPIQPGWDAPYPLDPQAPQYDPRYPNQGYPDQPYPDLGDLPPQRDR